MQARQPHSKKVTDYENYEQLAVTIIYTAYVDYMLNHWSYEDMERWVYSEAFQKLTTMEPKTFLENCKKAKENGLWHYQKTYTI